MPGARHVAIIEPAMVTKRTYAVTTPWRWPRMSKEAAARQFDVERYMNNEWCAQKKIEATCMA